MEIGVYIWGTGKIASRYMNMQELNEKQILGFVESHKTRDTFYGKKVYEPQEIKNSNFDYILVCIYGASPEIYNIVKDNELPIEKIVFVDKWEWLDGTPMNLNCHPQLCKPICIKNNAEKIKDVFPILYQRFITEVDMQAERYLAVQRNGFDLKHEDSVLETKEFSKKEYWFDYFRFRSFELMVNEIKKYNIEGATAEVGVYRGGFSKLINTKFPDKKLYLFDTFESFSENEFSDEVDAGYCDKAFLGIFKNTSEEEVLGIMPHPENCIIRKGFFPETAIGLENERYAFVSIDVDLEKSILEGLRYFYPKLNEGGSIFLHDYNNYFLEGVKKAVDRFEEEIGKRLIKVPFADEGGTLVICK